MARHLLAAKADANGSRLRSQRSPLHVVRGGEGEKVGGVVKGGKRLKEGVFRWFCCIFLGKGVDLVCSFGHFFFWGGFFSRGMLLWALGCFGSLAGRGDWEPGHGPET